MTQAAIVTAVRRNEGRDPKAPQARARLLVQSMRHPPGRQSGLASVSFFPLAFGSTVWGERLFVGDSFPNSRSRLSTATAEGSGSGQFAPLCLDACSEGAARSECCCAGLDRLLHHAERHGRQREVTAFEGVAVLPEEAPDGACVCLGHGSILLRVIGT